MQLTRCFDIGGTKIVAADVSATGEIHELGRFSTPTHSFSDFVATLRTHCPAPEHPIGLSIAGVIQPDTGLINSVNIPALVNKPLAHVLSESLGRSVHVINDANAFALAENNFGAARGHDVVLAIILGTGVGGSIVINGQLLNGAGGTAGEWGHGPASTARTGFKLPDVRCQCGQSQCIDSIGSARGLERLYQQISSASLSSEAIIAAWQAGAPLAEKAVDVWLDVVGGALASAINIIDPSIVVVGGGLANATHLVAALDQEVANRRLAKHDSMLLKVATKGPEQGLLGAAIHCLAQQP